MARKRVRKNYFKNSQERRRQRVIGRWLLSLKVMSLLAGMAGTSLLFILVYDAVTQSSYFEAKTIEVEGNQNLSKESILKQVGLKPHDNILSVNVSMLRHTLMQDPWIATAEIERSLPDTIHIRVKERTPVAMIDLKRLFYLDQEGEVFKPVEASDKVRLPVVTGLAQSDIDFNDPWRSEMFKAVMEVLRLSQVHEKVIPFYTLHRVQMDKQTGLTLYASLAPFNLSTTPVRASSFASKVDQPAWVGGGAVAIRFGFKDYESKFSRLRFMVSHLRTEGELFDFRFIDLNDTDRVVVRPSSAGQDGIRSVAGDSKPWSAKRKEV